MVIAALALRLDPVGAADKQHDTYMLDISRFGSGAVGSHHGSASTIAPPDVQNTLQFTGPHLSEGHLTEAGMYSVRRHLGGSHPT